MEIITGLFDDEYIQEAYGNTCREEGKQQALKDLACKNTLAGKSVDDIADFLGESVETVTQWLVEEGILTPAKA